jgi:8-oxo-dGDP phosphatase
VSYIVVGALINDDGEVLMMQEAKSSCAGKWYLPAGHLEPGENIMVCSEVISCDA